MSKNPGVTAAIEITAGTWTTAILNGGLHAGLKSLASIDGVEHRLRFTKPLFIPVIPGRHILEVYQLPKLGLINATKRQNLFSLEVDVAPYTVRTFLYREHYSTLGPLFNKMKSMTLKETDTRPFQPGVVGSSAPQSNNYQQQPVVHEPLRKAAYADTPQGKAKFCTSCGQKIPPQARFCAGCGQQVTA